MPSEQRKSPTVRQLKLVATLKRLREDTDLTLEEVQEKTDISISRLSRIESGKFAVKLQEVRLLATAYGVSTDVADELRQLARESSTKGWWDGKRRSRVISEKYSTLIGLELGAEEILSFNSVVPGLFQTADYARALIKDSPAELTSAEIDSRVEVRLERQQILFGDDPVRFWVIMDEAALARPVGGHDVHRRQMERLLELADEPKIIMQVLPFSAGAHPATTGSYSIIQFREAMIDPVVYVETIAGELFVEDPTEVAEYQRGFQYLHAKASSPEDTLARIARTASRQE